MTNANLDQLRHITNEHLVYQADVARVSRHDYPVCHIEDYTTLMGVCRAQVPGLAPPGVVIPQLGSALRAGAPGPPGVVIPQLASKLRLSVLCHLQYVTSVVIFLADI